MMTLSVYADSSVGTHVVGAAFSIDAIGGNSIVQDMSLSSVASWGQLGEDDFGYDGAGGHAGAIMGQIVFIPAINPDAGSSLGSGPVLLATFNVLLSEPVTASSDLGWQVASLVDADFALEVIDANANPGGTPQGEVTRFANPEFGTFVVPAPSAMAVLGLGGLVAGRRRR